MAVKITITNKCKEYVLNAEKGIKFQIKGYAFLLDRENILSQNNLETIQLKDLYRRNPSENDELIVYDPTKDQSADILYKLFDTTYIPALEVNTSNAYTFGTYTFKVDQSLNPYKLGGFCASDYNADKFDAILVIGQRFKEENTYVSALDKCFLAAIITNDNEGFQLDDLTDGGEPYSQTITWDLTIAETNNLDNLELSTQYKDFVDNHKVSLKDHQTTRVSGDKPLFLVPANDLNYDYEINTIRNKTAYAIESATNVEPFEGVYDYANIVLTDETEKINNLWNISAAVTIFDRHDSNIVKPQIMLSYGVEQDDVFNTDAVALYYSRTKNFFSLSQATGNDKIQVNLFPEDMHDENKFCVDEEIKAFNNTVISAESATSGNQRFFRLHSNGGYYAALDNEGNILPETFSQNTFEVSSKRNNLVKSNDNALLISNDNLLNDVSSTLFLNSTANNLQKLNEAIFINANDVVLSSINNTDIYQHSYIGVNGIRDIIPFYGYKYSFDNITYIGNNYHSQTHNPFKLDETYYIVNDIKHIKGKFSQILPPRPGDEEPKIENNSIEYDTGITSAKTKTDLISNVSNVASIGHEGLVATKNFYTPFMYEGIKYEGYSDSLNVSSFLLTGDRTASIPNDYSVVFGNYNSYMNPFTLKSENVTSIKDYYKFYKGELLDGTVNNTISSIYNTSHIYSTDGLAGDAAPFSIMHFNNQQDNYFCGADTSGSYNDISADEGDYSLNKIFVVGGGESYTNRFNQIPYTPAENVSKFTDYNETEKRIDLFSVEKDSYQLIHNNNYDENPHFSATKVGYIPSMFAVRGWKKPVQKYHYRFTSGWNQNNNLDISCTMTPTINNFHLQNTIYTPDSILFPMIRSSNDVYRLNIEHIYDYINGNTIQGVTKYINYAPIQNKEEELMSKRYTYVYRTAGVKTVKGTKGLKGTVSWRYKMYIEDLFDGLNKKGANIHSSGVKGTNAKCYTIYLFNENPTETLTFKGIRMRKVGSSYQTLRATRYIRPGEIQRIMYIDNGYNGEYGVVNFGYFNENNGKFNT